MIIGKGSIRFSSFDGSMMQRERGWLKSPVVVLFVTGLFLIADGGDTVPRGDVTASATVSTNPCPTRCTCRVDRVVCVNANLTALSLFWSPNVSSLILIGNDITALRATIDGAENLLTLSLVSSNLQHLSPNAFRSLPKLRVLDLGDNRLAGKLGSRLFEELVSLDVLNISRNKLSSIENDSLTGLTKLRTLDLSFNSIERIDEDAFLSLLQLETLDLSNNRVINLSALWFRQLTQLKVLRLARNHVQSTDNFHFQNLRSLEVLDIGGNNLASMEPRTFDGLVNLKSLNLSGNNIVRLHQQLFRPLMNLKKLDLSANSIDDLNYANFRSNSELNTLLLDHLPNLTSVGDSAFAGAVQLTHLSLANNPSLHFIHPDAFKWMSTALHLLDLSGNNLTSLHHQTLAVLRDLKRLLLFGNPWICNCHLAWLPKWLDRNNVTLVKSEDSVCRWPGTNESSYVGDLDAARKLNCSKTAIASHSEKVYVKFGATALLECQVTGDPPPSLIWILPRSHIFHLYPSGWKTQWYLPYREDHPLVHDKNNSLLDTETSQRIRILKNGNLYISKVLSVDAGTYLCVASNTFNNDTARITLTLNYQILIHVKVVSILVGFATSIAALLLLLIVQLINMALNRWGCCCCQRLVSPKAKQIRKMLEGIEQYKSQQLDRLRDNYAMQVNRIKDNCAQQMDRIRESYGTQVERLRDIRDFGTQQLDKVRDQYYEQVKKVRDYSSQQMSKVRENYIFQRNRVRKFSGHQLIRLRENYKLQQQHLNKILETLNIESCRTGCSRSESLDFTGEDDAADPVFDALPPSLIDPCSFDSDSQSQSDYFTPNNSRPPSCEYFNETSCPSTPNKSPPQPNVAKSLVGIEPIKEIEESCVSPSTDEANARRDLPECAINVEEEEENIDYHLNQLQTNLLNAEEPNSEGPLTQLDADEENDRVDKCTRETAV